MMKSGPGLSLRSSISNELMIPHFFIIMMMIIGMRQVIDIVMVRNVMSLPGVKRVSPDNNMIIIIQVGWKMGWPIIDIIFAVFILSYEVVPRGFPIVRGISTRCVVLSYSLFPLKWLSARRR